MKSILLGLLMFVVSASAQARSISFMAYMCGSSDQVFLAPGQLQVYHAEVRITGTSAAANARAKTLAARTAIGICKNENSRPAKCTPASCVKFRDTIPVAGRGSSHSSRGSSSAGSSDDSSGSSSSSDDSSGSSSNSSSESSSGGDFFCPGDGKYHAKPCEFCPGDGHYHSGNCSFSPGDGAYHSGTSTFCPGDGKYHGGPCEFCPGDGKYHVGQCSFSPGSGGYAGSGDD